jgi:transcriptional regulator
MPIPNVDEYDRQIMKMRAVGYSQAEIANSLGISQSAVSQRIQKIRRQAESQDVDKAFWELLLGLGAIYLISKLLDAGNKGR